MTNPTITNPTADRMPCNIKVTPIGTVKQTHRCKFTVEHANRYAVIDCLTGHVIADDMPTLKMARNALNMTKQYRSGINHTYAITLQPPTVYHTADLSDAFPYLTADYVNVVSIAHENDLYGVFHLNDGTVFSIMPPTVVMHTA